MVGRPTGTIPTTLNIAYGRGDPWSNVTKDAPLHEKYGNPYGIAAMLMAMEVVETGGRMIWNTGGSGAYGIMQIKESSWGWLAKKLGADLKTREGQIAVAAEILGKEGKGANPRERFLYSYYPVLKDGKLCLTCKGEDGGTPQQYLDDIDTLIGIINAASGESNVTTEQDLLNLISNNAPGVYVSFDFLGVNNVSIYNYGKGHGTTGNNIHPGIDIWMPDETPVNAVFGGEVICVGTRGEEVWGQGCGYFTDDDGGIGKISVLTDRTVMVKGKARRMMNVYGHMSSSVVKPGQKIADGQRIGRSGRGGKFPHIHLDVAVAEDTEGELNNPRIWNNPGRYHLLNPLPAMLSALGGTALPTPLPERLDIPQPGEFDRTWTVTVTVPNTPALLRADLNSPSVVAEPLAVGEQFAAAYLTLSDATGEPFWITKARSRVPARNTNMAEVLGIETTGGTTADLEAIHRKIATLLVAVDDHFTTAQDQIGDVFAEASI